MKKTTIQISMINKNNISNNNGEPRMTSIEIATLTGKQLKDVLKAIRNMEPAWAQVAGRKFALGSYEDINNQSRPCYFLSKTECLYIATKFNDEARARLILRWEELERERLVEMQKPKQKIKEIRLLACDEEVLDEADDILGEELTELNKYSKFCYTPTEIGKPFGLEGRDLNSFLADKGIIRWARGQWRLTQKYLHRDLTENRFRYIHGRDGRRKLESSLVWTEKGREFVLGLIR
jgi:phage regulator Rha-like protein